MKQRIAIRTVTLWAIGLAVFGVPAIAPAQPPIVPIEDEAPLPRQLVPAFRQLRRPENPVVIELSALIPMKIDLDDGLVIAMVDSYRLEKREVTIVEMKMQEVTQSYTAVDGTMKERVVKAMRPVQKVVNRDVSVPAGIKPKKLPLEDFKFFDLEGNPLLAEHAAERLTQLKPVFLLDRFSGKLPTVGRNALQVLRADTLIVTTRNAVTEVQQKLDGF